jgi:microcystin-dependent protein
VSNPYYGEIRMFAGNFAPTGWAFCNGQLLSIAQNNALFSILGTTYGGDGMTNFALPDLRGRAPMHWQQGPGLTYRELGDKVGTESVQLTNGQMPTHTHQANASSSIENTTRPSNAVPAKGGSYTTFTPDSAMSSQAIGTAGNNQAHENMPPQLAVSFIIALTGIYPSRS